MGGYSMKLHHYLLAFAACLSLCYMGYGISPLDLDMSSEPLYGYAYIVRNLYIMFVIFLGIYLLKMYLDHKDN